MPYLQVANSLVVMVRKVWVVLGGKEETVVLVTVGGVVSCVI